MAEDSRVVTTKLSATLASRLDEWSRLMDRSKSWILREALRDWLEEEDRRHKLTLEALADVEAGRTISQEEVEQHLAERRAAREKKA